MNKCQRTLEEQYVDSWDRFFNQAKLLHENGIPVEEQCGRMCNIMMTRDERLRVLVKKHFQPEDYFYGREWAELYPVSRSAKRTVFAMLLTDLIGSVLFFSCISMPNPMKLA